VDSRDLAEVRRTLWAAADQLRANSTLAPSEYRSPVLGLIFLAYAEHRFDEVRPEIEAKATPRRPINVDDYRSRSVCRSGAMAAPCHRGRGVRLSTRGYGRDADPRPDRHHRSGTRRHAGPSPPDGDKQPRFGRAQILSACRLTSTLAREYRQPETMIEGLDVR